MLSLHSNQTNRSFNSIKGRRISSVDTFCDICFSISYICTDYWFSLEHKSQLHFLRYFSAFQAFNLTIYPCILRIASVSLNPIEFAWMIWAFNKKKKLSSEALHAFAFELSFGAESKLFSIFSSQWRRFTYCIDIFYVENFHIKWNERIAHSIEIFDLKRLHLMWNCVRK